MKVEQRLFEFVDLFDLSVGEIAEHFLAMRESLFESSDAYVLNVKALSLVFGVPLIAVCVIKAVKFLLRLFAIRYKLDLPIFSFEDSKEK